MNTFFRMLGLRSMILCAVITFALISPTFVGATEKKSTDGPSLEETKQFIADTLPGCGILRGKENTVQEETVHSLVRDEFWIGQAVWEGSSLTVKRRAIKRDSNRWNSDNTWAGDYILGGEFIDSFNLVHMADDVTVGQLPESGAFFVRLHCASGGCVSTKNEVSI